MDQAVGLGLAADNVARRVKTPRVPQVRRRTITPAETQRLLAECDGRFAAAVGLCYLQGWRISEALGLAWQDIDLETRTVRLRHRSTYTDGVGMVLGPTKTRRTAGVQSLSPSVIGLLAKRREVQDEDRVKLGGDWPSVDYDGDHLDLVFTTATGSPMLRQHVDRAIRAAATRAGLDSTGLGTHAGRRSVVTSLFASGSLDLGDVARFVGHSDTSTTPRLRPTRRRPAEADQRACLRIARPELDCPTRRALNPTQLLCCVDDSGSRRRSLAGGGVGCVVGGTRGRLRDVAVETTPARWLPSSAGLVARGGVRPCVDRRQLRHEQAPSR